MAGLVIGLYALGALAVLYWIVVRLWYLRWGVTDAELTRPMLGDKEVADPNYAAMVGVTIDARPEHIWPWLLQMGNGRGGMYSYDWLDRLVGYLNQPSARRSLPESRHSGAGIVPLAGAAGGFPVLAVAPYQALVFSGEASGCRWEWELDLYALDKHHTRLISRNRARFPRSARSPLLMLVLEPAAFIMTRKTLLGIKRRAEALSQNPDDSLLALLPERP
jgi:hypothetical protein